MRIVAIAASMFVGLAASAAQADAPLWRAEGARDGEDPRAVVELLTDVEAVAPGGAFRVGVRFSLDPGWHVYWHNPGDGAMATDIALSGDGVTYSPLAWPTPRRFEQAGFIVTYGYAGEVVLLAEARVAPEASGELRLRATVDFLVCEVECIPDRLTLTRSLPVRAAAIPSEGTRALFTQYTSRVPVTPAEVGVDIHFTLVPSRVVPGSDFTASVLVTPHEGELTAPTGGAPQAFFPHRIEGIELRPTAVRADTSARGAVVIEIGGRASSDRPRGERRFTGVVALSRAGAPLHFTIDAPLPSAPLIPATAAGSMTTATGARIGPNAPVLPLWRVLLLALLGGLVLNLMPCVLPVLAIKAFGLVSVAGEGIRARFLHAASYTGGILASFAALAVVIVLLRAGGTELGWGFQLQEPIFVSALAAVLVVFALHLFGVFELTLSASELSARVDHSSGGLRSFGEGVLAVVVATPCSAPFLGTAVGFALAADAWTILPVFLAIGLGLAAPFVLLVLVPGARRILPRPGAWMAHLKALLGFALLATVIWLVWVLGQTTSTDGVTRLLAFLLVIALATWIFATWTTRLDASVTRRAITGVFVLALVAGAGAALLRFDSAAISRALADEGSAAWSPEAVRAALEEDRPVFVDFTADWCITCKVNEKLVLDTEEVRAVFRHDRVLLLKGDWTRRDEVIRAELARHGRGGVPLYLFFSPRAPDAPEVLPEVLTTDIVLDALQRARGPARNPS